MSEDKEGLHLPAGESNASERWGNPPLWSPWNFQDQKPNRELQKHIYRAAHARPCAQEIAK